MCNHGCKSNNRGKFNDDYSLIIGVCLVTGVCLVMGVSLVTGVSPATRLSLVTDVSLVMGASCLIHASAVQVRFSSIGSLSATKSGLLFVIMLPS